jgi:hypothetical protein
MVMDSSVKARPGKAVGTYSLAGYAVLLMATVALGVWFGPRLWAVYQLQVGGRLLESALGSVDSLEWWYIGPREVKDAHALEAAVAHLQQAESTSRAWRLLGQAQMAREDLLASIEALERFTALRPGQALGRGIASTSTRPPLACRRITETGPRCSCTPGRGSPTP